MKYKISDDKDAVNFIRQKLKENGGYCPCVLGSRGQAEYKCPCKDFREKVEEGETCHCGLFVKVKK